MADLIIKPATGTGNKLIVKDMAGGAVLTTADSGATVANATLTAPTIASMANCTFPAGHVIGMWSNSRTNNSTVVTSNSGGQSSNPDSLVDVATGSRVYSEELSVTVDVSSTTSDLFVIGTIGVGNSTWSNKGAYGMVLNIPSPTENRGYQTDNYPWYGAENAFGASSGYGVGKTVQASVKGSDSRVKSGSYAIKIYVFAYNETSPSRAQTINVYNSYITVFEIKR